MTNFSKRVSVSVLLGSLALFSAGAAAAEWDDAENNFLDGVLYGAPSFAELRELGERVLSGALPPDQLARLPQTVKALEQAGPLNFAASLREDATARGLGALLAAAVHQRLQTAELQTLLSFLNARALQSYVLPSMDAHDRAETYRLLLESGTCDIGRLSQIAQIVAGLKDNSGVQTLLAEEAARPVLIPEQLFALHEELFRTGAESAAPDLPSPPPGTF